MKRNFTDRSVPTTVGYLKEMLRVVGPSGSASQLPCERASTARYRASGARP
jgi:hypothetical protein